MNITQIYTVTFIILILHSFSDVLFLYNNVYIGTTLSFQYLKLLLFRKASIKVLFSNVVFNKNIIITSYISFTLQLKILVFNIKNVISFKLFGV
jgi:hypothetical protein